MPEARSEDKATREELRALAARLRAIREQERCDLACGLHDGPAQLLTVLRFDLTRMRRRLGGPSGPGVPPELPGDVERTIETLDAVIRQVRDLAAGLCPVQPGELGLIAAVEGLAGYWAERSHTAFEIGEMPESTRAPLATVVAAVRLLEEIATFAVRRGKARSIRVSLADRDDALLLDVSCASVQPVCAEERALVLLEIRERAAAVCGSVTARDEAGPDIGLTVAIPYAPIAI